MIKLFGRDKPRVRNLIFEFMDTVIAQELVQFEIGFKSTEQFERLNALVNIFDMVVVTTKYNSAICRVAMIDGYKLIAGFRVLKALPYKVGDQYDGR